MNFTGENISYILETNSFYTEYQPIISLKDYSIFGYEALARFNFNGALVPPDIIFNGAHKNSELFFDLESAVKKFQVEEKNFDGEIFLKFDSHVFEENYQLKHWTKFLKDHKVYAEIVEHQSIKDNFDSINFFLDWLKEYKIPFGIDEMGKKEGLFTLDLINRSSFIKLDKFWINRIVKNVAYKEIVKGIVAFAKANKQFVVLEGIESKKGLELALELGVDYVQGYFFKEMFITVKNSKTETKKPPQKSHINADFYDNKKSSESFIIDMDELTEELIEEIRDLEYEMLELLSDDEFSLKESGLSQFIARVERCAACISGLVEFEVISSTLREMNIILEAVTEEQLESKDKSLKIFLDGLIQDLKAWRVNIFEKGGVKDIHYLDDSFYNSLSFLKQKITEEDHEESGDLELF